MKNKIKINCTEFSAFERVAKIITENADEVKDDDTASKYIKEYEDSINGFFSENIVKEIEYAVSEYLEDIKEENKEMV